MKTYRDSLDSLSFSESQKQSMVDRLMAAQVQPKGKKRPLRRVVGVAVAAALVFTVTAGATGGLQTAGEALSGLFGTSPAQTEVIDRIGYPINASATSGGVTITADAIMADRYSYAVVYSIQREDGAPLLPEGVSTVSVLPMDFARSDLDTPGFWGGAHGTSYFTDNDPADPAIQYVDVRTVDTPMKTGTAKATFETLRLFDFDAKEYVTLAEGKWTLKFDFNFADCSIDLPAGQHFTLNGMDATLDSVILSPLSIQIEYTVNHPWTWITEDEDGNSLSVEERAERMNAQGRDLLKTLPVLLTLADGSTLDMTDSGGGSTPDGEKTVCQKGDVFENILPLDEVVSVTVGDMTIPVQ